MQAKRHSRYVPKETFAARDNRLKIIEGGVLKHLLAEHLDIDVRVELPKNVPRH
jgi:hypothetical protein